MGLPDREIPIFIFTGKGGGGGGIAKGQRLPILADPESNSLLLVESRILHVGLSMQPGKSWGDEANIPGAME